MRLVRFGGAMSLDGYIAGPDGDYDWIVMDPEIDFEAFSSQFDTILMGRRTFEWIKQAGGGGSMPEMDVFIVSRTLKPKEHPGVSIVDDPKQLVTELRSKPGKDIWLFGGGSLFRSLLELGLVDSVEVAVIPVLLGGGLPLLPHPAPRSTLRLVNHRIYPKTGTVSLEYATMGRAAAPSRKAR